MPSIPWYFYISIFLSIVPRGHTFEVFLLRPMHRQLAMHKCFQVDLQSRQGHNAGGVHLPLPPWYLLSLKRFYGFNCAKWWCRMKGSRVTFIAARDVSTCSKQLSDNFCVAAHWRGTQWCVSFWALGIALTPASKSIFKWFIVAVFHHWSSHKLLHSIPAWSAMLAKIKL